MTEDEQQQRLEQIAERIASLAKAREGKPILVSAIGIALGEDLRLLKLLTGRGLNQFIQDQLGGVVTLVRLGTHRNVTAIIYGTPDATSVMELEGGNGEPKRRFHYRFWAAFSVPAKGEVRVLHHDLTFDDVAKAEVPEEALTIANDLIAPEETENRDELIKANIASWLETQGLPEDRFLAPRRLPNLQGAGSNSATGSLLEAVFAALDRKQLQSTNLSLDVVATLLRTPRG